MRELIEKAIPIIKRYEEEEIRNGYGNNIYSMLDMERDEVKTHEHTIYSVFQNQNNNEIKQKLFAAFMRTMELEEKYSLTEWEVEKEYFIGDGRIDLFFHSCDNKMAVVVELKIDAEDQSEQLTRYYDYVQKESYADYEIVYLTIDGREPSEQSVSGIPETCHVRRRSFGEHVVNWLSECIDVLEKNSLDSSLLKQYEILLKKITQETNREREIEELFCDRDSLLAGMALVDALEEAKGKVICQFFDKLSDEISADEDSCEYCDEVHTVWVKVIGFHARNTTYSLWMCVDIDEKLECYVIYLDKNEEPVKSSDFKERYKKINGIVEESIAKVFRTRIRENRYTSIYYENVRNSKNQEYNFKNFGENCADLKDDAVMERETKYIAGQLVSYVRELREMLIYEFEDNGIELVEE